MAVFVFGSKRSRGALHCRSYRCRSSRIAIWASYQLGHGKNGRGLAIVTGENVEARLATADNANAF